MFVVANIDHIMLVETRGGFTFVTLSTGNEVKTKERARDIIARLVAFLDTPQLISNPPET